LFPFADEPQTNPQTGELAGLLDKLREHGVMPKVMYTDTSSEYWRGDAGLAHTRLADNSDADLPGDVRRYLFASTQHGPGLLPYADRSVFGSHGSNVFNAVDYRPLFRAALENLRRWVMDDISPPDSVFPRRDDGTGMTRAEVIDRLTGIDGLSLPKVDRLPRICPLELGPRSVDGIGSFPARLTGRNYPTVVAAVDSAGNEIGGVRMPDVEVPVAIHTGFNPRHMDSGGAGQTLEYVGSTLPLGDLEQRYTNKDDYLQRVRAAAQELIDGRLVLEQDIELCIAIASERYDAASAELRGANS
ncbi:MAG: alpha/beta hydrolase domain-containing protein, partial [Gammaproteobacteria bacterium]